MTVKKPTTTDALNLSVKKFALMCDMSESTVRSLIDRGELRGIRIGTVVRIPVSEFKRLGLDSPTVREVA
ncbi:helix-turn-helix domain-containing protein [Schaalia hyovaginalis]|uniref:Excisionase family DNA binding protein n=1 Tax=Schaalia hyovaginalis TaxID=29316 RepID=A0A923E567_9ACTO|nr:helix-turn-helix domain-containing protein [Schaalia hyovaginalis]MBB6333841.1 excisionase family DNA binding protein [Schaalia hyovaginalis]